MKAAKVEGWGVLRLGVSLRERRGRQTACFAGVRFLSSFPTAPEGGTQASPAAAVPPAWVLFVIFRGEILGLSLLLRRTSIFCCVNRRREGICGSRRLLLALGFQALVSTLEASAGTQRSAELRVQGWAQRREP